MTLLAKTVDDNVTLGEEHYNNLAMTDPNFEQLVSVPVLMYHDVNESSDTSNGNSIPVETLEAHII